MNEEYLDLFVDESTLHLQELNQGLMSLESEPENLEIIQTVFRAAHTLKGMAGTMGFTRMAGLTHQMENGLDKVRQGQLAPTEAVIDALFACVDVLEAQLQAVIETGSDAGVDETAAAQSLSRVLDGDEVAVSAAVNVSDAETVSATGPWWADLQGGIEAVLESGISVFEVGVTMVPDCPMPGVRAFMAYRALADIGEVLASDPSAELIQDGECGLDVKFVLASDETSAGIADSLRNMPDIGSVNVQPLRISSSEDQAGSRVSQDEGTEQGEGHGSTPAPKGAENAQLRATASVAPASQESETPHHTQRSTQTIRVDQEKIDALINLFSEFVIDKTRLESISSRLADGELSETVSHIARLGSELQDVVLQIRMVPVESVFNRFPRMVRDLSKTLNKQVHLEIFGAQTELDRTLVDEIGDPLVHLIRNALDHGLESPDERERAGKQRVGKLRLEAYQARNRVYIEIADDGRGIDRSRVLDKAIQKGQVAKEAAVGLSDHEVYDLLFQSGFSTAETVSDISGRGVGLDAVKNKIQSLGGDVRITSTPGQGSRFIIELPLTLSIMQAMLVRIGDETYAVPLAEIAHILRVGEDEIQGVGDQDMVLFMDKPIPLVHLPALLGEPGNGDTQGVSAGATAADSTVDASTTVPHTAIDLGLAVLVVKKGDRYIGLEVDEFLSQQEVVIKSIGSYFKTLPSGVAGATILGDGRVALILDTHAWTR